MDNVFYLPILKVSSSTSQRNFILRVFEILSNLTLHIFHTTNGTISFFIGHDVEAIRLRNGERISLFDGEGLRIHYSDKLIRKMAQECGLSVIDHWTTHSINLTWVNRSTLE